MDATMMQTGLTIGSMLRHGASVYPDSVVSTYEGADVRQQSYALTAARAARLANGLASLGVQPGDRVGTFAWNTAEHLECYLGVPAMGAVLHTLNLRLFPEQLAYVVNDAEDRVVVVDASVAALLARVAGQLTTVRHVVVVGDRTAPGVAELATLGPLVGYEELLAEAAVDFDWPDVPETSAAAMCYTSGTTGNPKGVVYSHRSTWLHSLVLATGNALGLREHDKVLPVVPMFHANAWGLPYGGWLAGSDLLMPGRYLQAEPLARMISSERPTVAGAVPTIWNDLLEYAVAAGSDLTSLRLVACGGSAVPRRLMERFEAELGVRIIQAWGMTETSPVAAVAHPPRSATPEQAWDYRDRAGRVTAGVELRIVDDAGTVLPWDGESVGEVEVRGPWVTGSYYGGRDPERFHDGWLRTGDVACVDRLGFVRITDRSKDVIKSGGEWISSVEVENQLMAHPDVFEAAVVAVPDEKWQERPMACVVVRSGARVTAEELSAFLAGRVARWWVPERWAFVPEVPKTSVGKFDKKVLRARHAEGDLDVHFLAPKPG